MEPLRALAALACLAFLSGCTASQAGVSNMTDVFSYGGQLANKDGTQTYNWENTQGKALVSWGGQVASGSFTLAIKDATGKQVYSDSLGPGQGGMSGNTATGVRGDWTITLVFQDFTGQMGLSLTASGGSSGSMYTVPTYAPAQA